MELGKGSLKGFLKGLLKGSYGGSIKGGPWDLVRKVVSTLIGAECKYK